MPRQIRARLDAESAVAKAVADLATATKASEETAVEVLVDTTYAEDQAVGVEADSVAEDAVAPAAKASVEKS
jgi:hypothetical protein